MLALTTICISSDSKGEREEGRGVLVLTQQIEEDVLLAVCWIIPPSASMVIVKGEREGGREGEGKGMERRGGGKKGGKSKVIPFNQSR